ncbi:MAG: pyrroline-5-carboxylate reductase [Gammaproteobacteria bacterium]|nr:pyrroline-5-carboxylate reductase [Gammaproteobacteria bacterium]MCH9743684.1 pyrroline-5-carboxylate reductase [Gammaproteobacteria bacterium]
MKPKKIAFIGAGNMAKALVSGLINNGYAADCIWVTNHTDERLKYFADKLSVHTSTENIEAAKQVDVVVLCVKPKVMQSVCEEVGQVICERELLVVSVAAGIQTESIAEWLDYQGVIVRAMPNTPAAVGSGATGLFANAVTSDAQRMIAENIFESVGITAWVKEEHLIRAILAVAGSSPAYVFLLMEAMQQAALEMGLDAEVAAQFTCQSVLGAAKLAMAEGNQFAKLREAVTSPNGTTQAALDVFVQHDFKEVVRDAMQAALERAKELAEN